MVLETQIKAFQDYGRRSAISLCKQLISFSIFLSGLLSVFLTDFTEMMRSTRSQIRVEDKMAHSFQKLSATSTRGLVVPIL